MSIAVFLKENLKNIPAWLGQTINHIPYNIRPGIGKVYKQRQALLRESENWDSNMSKDFVFSKVKDLVFFSYNNIKFYKEYYESKGFHPTELRCFADIEKIPIVTKSILKTYSLEDRSFKKKGSYIVNTGGSSGEPFSFFIEPSSMGHEWAHMHKVWNKFGYHYSSLKLAFSGRSDVSDLVDYDVVRNHFAIDMYSDYVKVAAKLRAIVTKYKICYLHGYPSLIYDFALYCEENDKDLMVMLRRNLKGVFLGSEYPQKLYRDTIKRIFGIESVSWYGHTERAVLAYEKHEEFEYYPFITYGFAEAITNLDGEYNLVGTSYYNYSSPLIRYNTEDIIDDVNLDQGILKSFRLLKGREGEFVVDKKKKRINLTGLIFGRHHKLFNYCSFIQVKQIEDGKILIYYVSKDLDVSKAQSFFDSDNLDLDLVFERIDSPIRTLAGKINLLIK
ncbi:hypothetical protein [Myroides odoratimimus]|uniref:hypothetical protein n=1 Tax=Myroides odoratimimus TaxID=76832 RepID=UPI002579150F|nr:hypothetical protein [Myroides odoratimimus]MDM1500007.1 hypothetical protein [Myroides odoratimimus]